MKLRNIGASILALLMVAGTLLPLPASASAKRRVAIMPFEYGAVTANVGTVDVGKGIVSLLVTKLVEDGTISVIERQQLDNILKEQNFSVSDRADSSTACKIGKLLSVDAIITGTVTEFGVEKSSSGGHVPSIGMGYIPYVGSIGGFGSLSKKSALAKVAVNARMFDVNTGEVLAASSATGISKEKGSWKLNDGWDWSSSDFTTTVAGQAVTQAVDELAKAFIQSASKIPDNQSLAAQNVQGSVAYVDGNKVILNVGKKNGIVVGDTLQVERVDKEITDPDSGRVIKKITSTVALVNVIEADDSTATATIEKGTAHIKDTVKKVTTDVKATLLSQIKSSAGTSTAANGVKKPIAK